MEYDLQRYHGVDLADYWRGGLSLRRLSVLIAGLPPESATARKYAEAPGWDTHAFLLADLFQAFTGEIHPSRPQAKKPSRYADLRAALEAQKARLAKESPPPKEG